MEGPSAVARGAKVAHGAVSSLCRDWQGHGLAAPDPVADGRIDLSLGEPRVTAGDSEVLGTTYREPRGERLHTLFDQAIALLALFALAPLLLLLIVAIKLDSKGPAFYTQLRVGKERRPYRVGAPKGSIFECYKFRTCAWMRIASVAELMAQNQYKGGKFFKLEHDPRVTRLGAFLRSSSLDELPQLFNVLKGEMRLVGNRPLPVYEAEALKEDWMRTRFLAPAGITGLWQIFGPQRPERKGTPRARCLLHRHAPFHGGSGHPRSHRAGASDAARCALGPLGRLGGSSQRVVFSTQWKGERTHEEVDVHGRPRGAVLGGWPSGGGVGRGLPAEPANLTLEAVLTRAVRNNPNIRAAEAKLRQARLEKENQDLWWARTLRANANYNVLGSGAGSVQAITPDGTILPTAAIGVGFNLGICWPGPRTRPGPRRPW